jgi:hypothetical protein
MFNGEKRRVFAASNALDCESDLPDNPVRFVPENVARKPGHIRRVRAGQLSSWKWCSGASHSMSTATIVR